MTTPRTGAASGLPSAKLREVTLVLCATQLVSWGALFYVLPVLAPSIAHGTGWSDTAVVAAFTAAQLVAAGASVLVGRTVGGHGPRMVMTGGAVLGSAGLVGVACSPNLTIYALSWVVSGAAMSAVLYPPAFAALTEWGGPRRVQALTALTLAGGFASTVFAPSAGFLVGPIGWRATYLAAAALLLATAPLLWRALRHDWRPADPKPLAHRRPAPSTAIRRTPAFLRLTTAAAVISVTQAVSIFFLIPLLVGRGMSLAQASVALGLGGVGQVCGRLGYGKLEAITGVTARTRLVFATVALTTLMLATVSGPAPLVFALSFAAGAARGAFTLIHATAVTDRWGTEAYAPLNGALSAAITCTGAIAPWIGTAVADLAGGHTGLFLLAATLAASAVLVVPQTSPSPPTLIDHPAGREVGGARWAGGRRRRA